MRECPIQRFPFWEQLTAEQQKLLCSSVQLLVYQEKQVLGASEASCKGIIMVERGVLRIGLMSEDGRQVTISRITDGGICVLSASCVIPAITFDVEIDAETECEVLVIPAPVVERLIQENIHVENFVYRSAIEWFSEVVGAVERILFYSLEQRLAAFLLDESARQNVDTLKMTQEQLAQNIGSAREAVTRAMKQLTQKGCVNVWRGTIEILDKKTLYQICGG